MFLRVQYFFALPKCEAFMNSYLSNIKAVNKKVPKNASAAPNSLPTVPHEGAVSLEGISLPFGGRWPKAGGGL